MLKMFLANLLKFTWAVSVGATGYKIRFGPGDGTFPWVIDAGAMTMASVPDDPAYRVAAVTAYGANHLESLPSATLTFRAPPPGNAPTCSVDDGYGPQWQACQTTVFQLNELASRLRSICGKKCARVK